MLRATVEFDKPGKQTGFIEVPHSVHDDAWGVIEELNRALTLNPNLCLLGDQIITGASVTRGGYVDEIGQAEPCLSRFYSAPSAFACKSTDPPRS